jgi:hypothetical protein
MKDALLDLVQHTHNLGVIDLIKVSGTDQETTINAIAEDRSVIVDATLHGAVAEFIGTFGMPNLGKLNTILGIPEYKENAQITITRQTVAAKAYHPVFTLKTKQVTSRMTIALWQLLL